MLWPFPFFLKLIIHKCDYTILKPIKVALFRLSRIICDIKDRVLKILKNLGLRFFPDAKDIRPNPKRNFIRGEAVYSACDQTVRVICPSLFSNIFPFGPVTKRQKSRLKLEN